jgi:hypothetical protein
MSLLRTTSFANFSKSKDREKIVIDGLDAVFFRLINYKYLTSHTALNIF